MAPGRFQVDPSAESNARFSLRGSITLHWARFQLFALGESGRCVLRVYPPTLQPSSTACNAGPAGFFAPGAAGPVVQCKRKRGGRGPQLLGARSPPPRSGACSTHRLAGCWTGRCSVLELFRRTPLRFVMAESGILLPFSPVLFRAPAARSRWTTHLAELGRKACLARAPASSKRWFHPCVPADKSPV